MNPDKTTVFERLVADSPRLEDLTSGNLIILLGLMLRSEVPGMFLLALPGGRTLQLETKSVRKYRVVEENGSQRLVQIEVAAADLHHSALLILAQHCCAGTHQVAYSEVTSPRDSDETYTMKGTTYPQWDIASNVSNLAGHTMHTIQDIVQHNPDAGSAESGGTTPFVMATPHHAPQAISMEQQGVTDPEGS